MTLFTYLDTKYRNLSLELQTNYTLSKEAELKAAYSLIQIQRNFFKWIQMPLLAVKYVLINARLLQAPELHTALKAHDAKANAPSEPTRAQHQDSTELQ